MVSSYKRKPYSEKSGKLEEETNFNKCSQLVEGGLYFNKMWKLSLSSSEEKKKRIKYFQVGWWPLEKRKTVWLLKAEIKVSILFPTYS